MVHESMRPHGWKPNFWTDGVTKSVPLTRTTLVHPLQMLYDYGPVGIWMRVCYFTWKSQWVNVFDKGSEVLSSLVSLHKCFSMKTFSTFSFYNKTRRIGPGVWHTRNPGYLDLDRDLDPRCGRVKSQRPLHRAGSRTNLSTDPNLNYTRVSTFVMCKIFDFL